MIVPTAPHYPKPGPVGGKLVRQVLADLRALPSVGEVLPLGQGGQPVFLAFSGGLDSTALFVLLVKYGRKILDKNSLRILHVNHGWRAEASDEDQKFVEAFGERWGVPVSVQRASPPAVSSSESWEEHARQIRYDFFEEVAAQNPGAWLLTAHQADDQAETVLWRIMTGATDTHGAGILRHPPGTRVLRPLLGVRRRDLQAFLEEEKLTYRNDSTNSDHRFLRVRVRKVLLPLLEEIFPRSVEWLTRLAERVQPFESDEQSSIESRSALVQLGVSLFWGASGLSLRKPHVKAMLGALKSGRQTQLDLPQGWVFRQSSDARFERWVLERKKAGD